MDRRKERLSSDIDYITSRANLGTLLAWIVWGIRRGVLKPLIASLCSSCRIRSVLWNAKAPGCGPVDVPRLPRDIRYRNGRFK